MPNRFQFNQSVLHSVVGGKSAIDMPALDISTLKEANAFLKAYGFDVSVPDQMEKLWYFHRRAMVLLTEKLDFNIDEIPEILRERKLLEDPRKLLLFASCSEENLARKTGGVVLGDNVAFDNLSMLQIQQLQRWSCVILRCCHVFVHAENDLFASFSEEIQKQILSPFQNCIYHDGTSGTTYLRRADEVDQHSPLALMGFESKPFKTSTSTVIKLLAKPNALAMNVFDKLGVRFVTQSMFDTFRVVRFLVEENLISYPHIIPDQSSNNIYPVDLFLQACVDIIQLQQQDPLNPSSQWNEDQVNEYFRQYLAQRENDAGFIRKENAFSGADYRFIKFIARKLVRVSLPGESVGFSFFYPFEVQIMDQESHARILSGPSHHQAYKDRQKIAARKRLDPQTL